MDVRIEGQRRGIVHAIPRPGNGQELAARGGNLPRRDTHPPGPGPAGSSDPADRTNDAAWFDANGDGVIESWSYAHGGDSFANFTPPPPRSTRATGHRTNDAARAAPATNVADHPDTLADTKAAIHHARAAYQRDGLSNAPAAHRSGGSAQPPGSPAPAAASRSVSRAPAATGR